MDIWSAYYKGSFECESIEYEKASISSVRYKVEHVFRIIKCQLGYRKVACRGLKKNENRLYAMFACANLYSLAIAGRKLSTNLR